MKFAKQRMHSMLQVLVLLLLVVELLLLVRMESKTVMKLVLIVAVLVLHVQRDVQLTRLLLLSHLTITQKKQAGH